MMELTAKERTIKYGVYALVILVAAVLQNVFSVRFAVGGARCFILVPAAVALGIDEDEKAAALYGLFGGVLCDMFSAQTRLFHSVFLMLACYVFSALVTFIFRSTFRYRLLACVITAGLYCLFYWLCFVLIGGGDGSGYMLVRFYLPSALYTVILSPFVCLFIGWLSNKLNKVEKIIG